MLYPGEKLPFPDEGHWVYIINKTHPEEKPLACGRIRLNSEPPKIDCLQGTGDVHKRWPELYAQLVLDKLLLKWKEHVDETGKDFLDLRACVSFYVERTLASRGFDELPDEEIDLTTWAVDNTITHELILEHATNYSAQRVLERNVSAEDLALKERIAEVMHREAFFRDVV